MYLTVNAGSSSLKVAVFDGESTDAPRLSVAVEGIGTYDAHLIPNGEYGQDSTQFIAAMDHTMAATTIISWLKAQGVDTTDVRGVGHRIVHGGEKYNGPVVIDAEVNEYLRSLVPLAPNHTPVILDCLTVYQQHFSTVPHVACFDTAFFHGLPAVAQTIAVPVEIRDSGVRRYGFHGLSYEYILGNFAAHEGEAAANGRVIIAHLGSGASLAAIKGGQPVDTTMGFTPASGIVMSTRTGDIDPGLIDYLLREKNMKPADISQLVYKQSGLLGISGTTADMYELLESRHDDALADLAVDLFCYTIKKTIGAYAAAMGGVDSLIFSAGIGERSAAIRRQITDGLEFLGIIIDDERNERGDRLISAEHSRVGVHVIPTHEDTMIAVKTIRLCKEVL